MKTRIRIIARLLRRLDRQRAWQQQREWFAATFKPDLYLASKEYWNRRTHHGLCTK
jgi:hypothetical protein